MKPTKSQPKRNLLPKTHTCTLHSNQIREFLLTDKGIKLNLEAHISALKAEFEAEKAETLKLITIEENRLVSISENQKEMLISRRSNGKKNQRNNCSFISFSF